MRLKFLLLSFLVFISHVQDGQILSHELKKRIEEARHQKLPVRIADQFLGLPYVENALSKQNPEQLITDLSGFDCVTLFDNIYALYASNGIDSRYLDHLVKVRYFKPGRITYENRNHYFSSTIEKLQKEGQLIPLQTEFDVTTKKDLILLSEYLKNKGLQINIDSLRVMEKQFSSDHFRYIPTKSIPKVLDHIQEGDLILFVTNNQHMDFHHVGFLVKKENQWHILHASQQYKKVIISPENLMEYMKKHPSFPGIKIYHLNLP